MADILPAVFNNGSSFIGSELLSLARSAYHDEFDHVRAKTWAARNVPTALQIGVAYLVAIFSIKLLMRNRQPFDLQRPLVAWNTLQAVFSWAVVYNTLPEAISTIANEGFWGANCNNTFWTGTVGAWSFAFVLSKVADIVDTFFIVLRKKPLLFLHYYHHVATITSFFIFCAEGGAFRPAVVVNAFVHSIMYSYYAVRALNIKVPGSVARAITTVQIVQFLYGVSHTLHVALEYYRGTGCAIDSYTLAVSGSVNFSFLVLFLNFFNKSYVENGGKAKYRAAPSIDAKNQ